MIYTIGTMRLCPYIQWWCLTAISDAASYWVPLNLNRSRVLFSDWSNPCRTSGANRIEGSCTLSSLLSFKANWNIMHLVYGVYWISVISTKAVAIRDSKWVEEHKRHLMYKNSPLAQKTVSSCFQSSCALPLFPLQPEMLLNKYSTW